MKNESSISSSMQETILALGLDALREKVLTSLEQKTLKQKLQDYISRQSKYNFNCQLNEEIDFQALVEFIQKELILDVRKYLFESNDYKRKTILDGVVNKAIASANPQTKISQNRAKNLILNAFNIIQSFYHTNLPDSLKYVIAQTTTEVTNSQKRILEEILQEQNKYHIIDSQKHAEEGIENNLEQINDDTKYYCEKYCEVLFLHRNLPNDLTITLKDVYTLPGAKVKKDYQWNRILKKNNNEREDMNYESIEDAIKEFIEYRPTLPGDAIIDILFIEGKAAMGKSSFISWLCWNYTQRNPKSLLIQSIAGRHLLSIKLRDIPRSSNGILNIQSPFRQLFAYLLKKDEKELFKINKWEEIAKNIFKNSLLVLEGFDELCMLENIIGDGKIFYFQNLCNELNNLDCNCKIIVTSRPEYLNVEKLEIPNAHIRISSFTELKRKEWLDKYEMKCSIPNTIRRMLLNDEVALLDGIVDSPLTLYMIVARSIYISNNSNLWEIYHEIFAKEVYKRDYEKGVPHAINSYRNILYRLTAEIANAVSNEQHLYITTEKLLNIKQIRILLSQITNDIADDIKCIIEDCFGLASYFRITEKTNNEGKLICAVEFYHNNIKDFFYSEYIWFHMEDIYRCLPNDEYDREKWFIKSFQELFQYSVYLKDQDNGNRSKTLDFLESKIRHYKENREHSEFVLQELNNHYFQHFFGKMMQTGLLSYYNYTGQDNILNMMACIFSSVLSIYRTVYLPYLNANERIVITEKEHTVDISTSLIFRFLFVTSNIHDLSHTVFNGIMLSGIKFGKHNFSDCSFQDCLMIGCDFSECDLRGADFSSSSLQRADFRNAILDESTVFSKETKFDHTLIDPKQFQYFSPWVNEKFLNSELEFVSYISSTQE